MAVKVKVARPVRGLGAFTFVQAYSHSIVPGGFEVMS